jgi:hypothetical protein
VSQHPYHTEIQDQADISSANSHGSTRNTIDPSGKSTPIVSQIQRKRKRTARNAESSDIVDGVDSDLDLSSHSLPAPELVDAVINVYFSHVHPWIPMLHEIKFRQRLSDPTQQSRIAVILHAMVVSSLRFVDTDIIFNKRDILRLTERSRNWVILNALDCLSVESLQSLVIIVFNDVSLN